MVGKVREYLVLVVSAASLCATLDLLSRIAACTSSKPFAYKLTSIVYQKRVRPQKIM